MKPERWRNLKEISAAALELEASRRGEYLARCCRGDARLLRDAERLVEGLEAPPRFLEPPDSRVRDMVATAPRDDRLGQRLGAYLLTDVVATGGMGTVYRALRADGEFDRAVAVKLIRPGLASARMLERFHRERQVLARLRHPYVTALLDGGTTEDGLPYLVMELVEGEPITEYCRRRNLALRERLDLFRKVCAAVEDAHRNLVIHRDLKPGNILVTAEGMPKLLDFGIAKLLADDGEDEEGTATRTLVQAMTPDYASPEQVRGEPITTASDVYSLAVVLYEMLTGHRPYDLAGRSRADVERVVCETVPSTRCLPLDLRKVLGMALRKEPQRRYSSVEQFSEDVGRFLSGLPVRARPDTVGYRVSKFVRRHLLLVTATSLLVLSLTAGVIGTTLGLVRAERARGEAETAWHTARAEAHEAVLEAGRANRLLQFLTRVLGAGGSRLPRPDLTVREVLDRTARAIPSEFGDDPDAELTLRIALGGAYHSLGSYQEAERHQRLACDLHRRHHPQRTAELASLLGSLAATLTKRGELEAAVVLLDEALRLQGEVAAENDETLPWLVAARGNALRYQGRHEEAEQWLRRAFEQQRDLLGANHPELVVIKENLAETLLQLGRFGEAEQLHREALASLRAARLVDEVEVGAVLHNLARTLRAADRPEEAMPACREALAIHRRVFDGDHPLLAAGLTEYAGLALRLGRSEDAEAAYREALAVYRRLYGERDRRTVAILENLGSLHREQGDLETAMAELGQALDVATVVYPAGHRQVLETRLQLGLSYLAARRFADALPLLEVTFEAVKDDPATAPHVRDLVRRAVESCRTHLGPTQEDGSLLASATDG